MMRGGTLSILGHGVKFQDQLLPPCEGMPRFALSSLGQAKKKNWFSGHFFSNQMRQAGFFFFFYFQSNIRHMCSTLLKTSLLLFGMLVSSAYGSGNDVLREEVMSTSKALRLLCIEGDWSFTFKVLLLLLSLCSTKLNLRYRPNNATASETLTDNMTLSKESVFDLPIDALTEKSLYLAGNSQPVPTLPLHIEV